jgi:uncharacterized protein (TIGR02996 family)
VRFAAVFFTTVLFFFAVATARVYDEGVSFVHHEPDITRQPCLGCDEMIAPAELHRHGYHQWKSCCLWHPYHYWCIRPATRALCPMDHCGECGEPLAPEEIAAAVQWAATLPTRIHAERLNARPAGVRLVAWWRRPGVDTEIYPPRGGVPAIEDRFVRHGFEIVHHTCATDTWREQLVAAPTDDDLRDVYADFLESTAQAAHAEFVRTVIRRRRATGDRLVFLDRRLRELRQDLPGSWCRDVARAC